MPSDSLLPSSQRNLLSLCTMKQAGKTMKIVLQIEDIILDTPCNFCQGATQQKVQTNKSDVGCQFLAIRSQDYYTRFKDMNSIQSKGFSTLYSSDNLRQPDNKEFI
jgi:hypothetical protein